MKRPLLLLSIALGAAPFAFGAYVGPQQAVARLQSSSCKRIASLSQNPSNLVLNSQIGSLYVFDSPDGFVVLPADDAAPALLAFSDHGKFDGIDNPGMAYWLDFYNRELEYLKGRPTQIPGSSASRSTKVPIKPLLTTEWNQEYPYNELCPKVNGHETVTGCVATAMAQVLKYHNYPVHGKGTHSYFWRPGEEELSFDYESTNFRWELMADRYDKDSSPESRHAVAELMLACGISVDMHYEPGGSGAATTQMGVALIDIFDYSPSLWMPMREYYGIYEWEDMIYADLAEGLPVLYSGAGTAGGHQFVCDGYSGDGYFHFNWGWGGMSNGYFLLTALNPADLGVGGGAGGFNYDQIATLSVRKPRQDDRPVYVFCNTEEFGTSAKSVQAGEKFTCSGMYFNFGLYTMPDNSRLGLKFTSKDSGEVKFVDGPGVWGYRPDDGRNNIQIIFPDLTDGSYLITPALHVDDKWLDVRMPIGYASSITAAVNDGVAAMINSEDSSVLIYDIDIPPVVYRDREFPMPFKVENNGDKEYYGNVTPLLLDDEGRIVAKSQFRPLDVLPGKTESIADYICKFVPAKEDSFPPGEYSLVFRDNTGKYVSKPITVKAEIMTEATEIKVSQFKIDDSEPVKDPAAVKFIFNVRCVSGEFFGALRIVVFPGDGGYDLYAKSSDRIYLLEGEDRNVEIIADLSRLADGEYMAMVYEGDKEVSDRVYFHIDHGSSSLAPVSTDNPSCKIYDLNGMEQTPPLSPGIYIINNRKVVVK